MGWNNGRQDNTKVYAEEQVSLILESLGIEVVSDAITDVLAYCPFHYNTDTPALCVSKETGAWICFNPACGERGTSLERLVSKLRGGNEFEARRFIAQSSELTSNQITSYIEKEVLQSHKLVRFDQSKLDEYVSNFWGTPSAIKYMTETRHIPENVLRKFGIGYVVVEKDGNDVGVVTMPVHDVTGMPVGYVGRSIIGKIFKNSSHLPKNYTFFNLHRAKAYPVVIVVESAIDVMTLNRAGYPNAIAILGGNVSEYQLALLRKHFSKIINMTDNDERKRYVNCNRCRQSGLDNCIGHSPGESFGYEILEGCPKQIVMWANYSDDERYPRGVKDVNEMTDIEIGRCVEGAISTVEYEHLACIR